MSFLPANLDEQAKSLPSSLMAAEIPSQALAPRTFADPSYLMEINAIRAKVADGTATKEDMKRAIQLIRETRGAVSTASTGTGPAKKRASSAGKTSAAKAKPNGQALLDML